MADRGRDIRIGLVSDTSGFDVTGPARDLEDLGQAADDVGRNLETLDRSVSGVDLDRLGAEARTASREVDSAFDTIGRASRASAGTVDASTDRMKGDLGGVKEEAGQTAREMGASFSSSGDIGDAFQELAAQAGQYFGPIGTALGVAGAIGVGLFRAQTEKLKEQVADLVDAIIDGGGRIGDAFVNVKLQDLAKEGDLQRVKDLVDQYVIAGVTYRDVARAKAGDADATARVNAALDEETARRKATTAELDRSEAAVTAISEAIGGESEVYRLAAEAAADYTEAVGVSAETLEAYRSTIESLAGPTDDLATATEDAARRQAEATSSTKDSWTDYRDTAVASIDDVIAAQERDIKAALDFQANSEAVFAAVGQAGVDWALAQGENADTAMQLLADAPLAKQQEVVANYTAMGESSGAGLAQGIGSARPAMTAEAARLHAAVKAAMGHKVTIPTGVDGSNLDREARIALGNLQAYYARHPVIVQIQSRYGGTRPLRDVP